jgi:hypothetical protein
MTEVRFRNAAESGDGILSLDRDAWLRLVFFLGVPLFLGILLGWLRVGATVGMPRGEAILFILSANGPVWLCYAAATAGIARLTARWPTWLAVKLAAGGLVGILLAYPLLTIRRILLDLPPLPSLTEPLAAFDLLLRYNASGIFTWVVVGLGFHYLAGLPMFGHAAATAPAADPAAPATVAGLQGRLPAHVRGPVRLLVASEHYLRVVTDRGEAMLLYRFGDAVAEQPRDRGAQVHRSYWIARDAVADVRRNGPKVTLGLDDGTEVPVSRTYLMDAKRAGIV